MHDSDYVMTCTNVIPSISNTVKKLFQQYDLYSSYNQTKYSGKDETIHNIFSTYIEHLLDYTNIPALVQE